ncbi:hypothetical protein DYB32_002805 [Aphanomyces invadans]|uniref:Uncharacterized protein n=1 Tax=Aphanomyces invadans TaxID=157072 RepID=A0A3R6YCD5_9STRA|nr:hypothetical protein DYB32_002805 [Aphanomyces invadans]
MINNRLAMVELIEIIVKGLCLAYAVAIYGVAQALKGESNDWFFLYMTYVLAMTCPWCAREWDARRKVVVVKEKKKKKPDIATKKDPLVGLTQAEILAAQREKAKDIGGIGDAKAAKKPKKPKGSPKRKGPPKKDKIPKGDDNV